MDATKIEDAIARAWPRLVIGGEPEIGRSVNADILQAVDRLAWSREAMSLLQGYRDLLWQACPIVGVEFESQGLRYRFTAKRALYCQQTLLVPESNYEDVAPTDIWIRLASATLQNYQLVQHDAGTMYEHARRLVKNVAQLNRQLTPLLRTGTLLISSNARHYSVTNQERKISLQPAAAKLPSASRQRLSAAELQAAHDMVADYDELSELALGLHDWAGSVHSQWWLRKRSLIYRSAKKGYALYRSAPRLREALANGLVSERDKRTPSSQPTLWIEQSCALPFDVTALRGHYMGVYTNSQFYSPGESKPPYILKKHLHRHPESLTSTSEWTASFQPSRVQRLQRALG